MALYVSRDVRCEVVDECLVLLDFKTEGYYIFDPVATNMWKALLATDCDVDALQTLANKYSVDRSRLESDLAAFRCSCLRQRFLQENEPDPSARVAVRNTAGPTRFLALHAWWCLFATARSLSARGFARTYLQYSQLPISKSNTLDADALLQRSVAAFALAEDFFLIKRAPQDCLPRSLAVFRFLRSVGLPVEHYIGVQRFPFQAHAWVEYNGRIVQDDPSRKLTFKSLARISL